MAYGFRIFGTSGASQIIDTNHNLQFTESGTATTDSYSVLASTIAFTWKDITVTGTMPVIAVRCSVHATVLALSNDGTSWTFRVFCEGGYGITGISFDYFVFDAIQEPGTDVIGLRIFTPSGGIAFDSGKSYLVAVGNGYKELATVGTPGSATFPTGRTYATVIAWPGYIKTTATISTFFGPVLGTRYSIATAKWTGDQVDWAMKQVYELGDGYPPPYDPKYGKILVVDVTGL